jgi:acetyl esterase/lipase
VLPQAVPGEPGYDVSEAGRLLPPPLDPAVATAYAEMLRSHPLGHDPALNRLENLPTLRAEAENWSSSPSDLRADGYFDVIEQVIAGLEPGDPEVSLLILLPNAAAAPTAAIYHIHGGGMVLGNNRTGLDESLGYAKDLGLALITVEYRLAPEHQYPQPVNDCVAGLVWLLDNVSDLNIDRDRILVWGASAGGGLAAATALICRDRGVPGLRGLMLMAPMLDDRNVSNSAISLEGIDSWDRASNLMGWRGMLGDLQGSSDLSPYASPARTTELRNMPPMLIDVGSVETFRDEAVAFAMLAWASGGDAELHVWPGGIHGFDELAPEAPISKQCRDARVKWIQRQLA